MVVAFCIGLKVFVLWVVRARSDSQQGCVMDVSPDGTKFWTPSCDAAVRPFQGQTFPSLAHGIDFYRQYASLVGFDVRCSSLRRNREGVAVKDVLVCSREGFKQAVQSSVVVDAALDQAPVAPKRRRVSNRVGCRARLVLKMGDDGVFVVHFIELRHNHCLCSDVAKPFLRGNRSMDVQHQIFVLKCARANVGPNRSFRLAREFAGSYSNVGATCVNFKNLKRDLMAFIGTSDAHIVVKKYAKKVDDCPDYVFRYDVDSQDQLCRAFWTDPIAKENFSAFGEVVSFDATYGTNRYGMVLVPFTGVDNHKRGVTFAMGLISREDVDSYVWLLQQFKSAMGCVPSCTITDQDPSMRVAVPQVFDTTRHRFWAIDAQRLAQAKLNAECEGHFPLCQTPMLIEKHAAAVYTINVFYDVQAEVIAGSFSCRAVRSNVEGLVTRYEVEDDDGPVRTVSFDSGNDGVECTCNMFSRVLGVQRGGDSEVDVAIGEAWAEFFSCVTLASRSVDHVTKLNAALKDFNAFLLAENGPTVRASSSKKQLFESFCGASPDGQVNVRPPPISNNKGGGKRYKSSRELAIEKSGRRQRQCQTCEKYGHNSRTCPMRNVDV
ncbi:PREDICTED: protein FAR1-RELATED SEQUENCE 5-like [Ipomoea nil]|uniref:protein FAR1-RELATED SEQUENCE 5-like n=1 Tax=Ipomoea nil TaxID=35883 RepID=UPI0009009DE0|nr:PREDICTED: protein FAR1-RELATED SEQUENCE 5-like [Ipomoea nil]